MTQPKLIRMPRDSEQYYHASSGPLPPPPGQDSLPAWPGLMSMLGLVALFVGLMFITVIYHIQYSLDDASTVNLLFILGKMAVLGGMLLMAVPALYLGLSSRDVKPEIRRGCFWLLAVIIISAAILHLVTWG